MNIYWLYAGRILFQVIGAFVVGYVAWRVWRVGGTTSRWQAAFLTVVCLSQINGAVLTQMGLASGLLLTLAPELVQRQTLFAVFDSALALTASLWCAYLMGWIRRKQ